MLIGSRGDSSKIDALGKDCVIASAGQNTIAKGAVGTLIALADFNEEREWGGFCIGRVGQRARARCLYLAQDGKRSSNRSERSSRPTYPPLAPISQFHRTSWKYPPPSTTLGCSISWPSGASVLSQRFVR